MIITIISSMRFEKEIIKTTRELSLAGHIVLAPVICSEEESLKHKDLLMDLHKHKINMSDMVFVINVDGYIGDGEREEIEYAKATHTPIAYMNYMQDRLAKNDRYTMYKGQNIQTIIYKGTNIVEARGCYDILNNKKVKKEPMQLTGTGYSVQVLAVQNMESKKYIDSSTEYEVSFKAIVL
jgi:hypothetical protein